MVFALAAFASLRRRADVGAFALLAKEAEEFDGTCACRPEPVRRSSVELGGFTRFQQNIVLGKNKAKRTVEDDAQSNPS